MHGKGGGVGVNRYMEFLHHKRQVTEFFRKKWHEAKENKKEIFVTFKNQIQRYF
jgi:hypothetical protein